MIFFKSTYHKKLLGFISLWHALLLGLAVTISGYIAFSGVGTPAENALRVQRDGLLSRPASGDIHIIEIDAKSLKKLNQWPWPREYHARMIDLLKSAGAAQIAFDVDFSSRSRAGGDHALADSLKRAGGSVILPTMRQAATSIGDREIANRDIESLPLEEFRNHSFLASVNVQPDQSGQVNSSIYGTITADIPRPSLAAMISGKQGAMESAFRIDQSINPATIPRHSFADILDGTDLLAGAEGKTFIIGGTAIEMGDRYGIARFGIQPGVVIQTLAAETLLQGRVNPSAGPLPLLFFALVTTLLRFAYLKNRITLRRAATFTQVCIIASVPLITEYFNWFTVDIVPALVFLSLVYSGRTLLDFMAALRQARLIDRDSGLHNLASMMRAKARAETCTVAVMRIDNYADISTVLGPEERGDLMRKIVERLSMVSAGKDIYRVDTNSLAWFVHPDNIEVLHERFDAAAAVLRGKMQMQSRSVSVSANFGAASGGIADLQSLVTKADLAAQRAARRSERWGWHDDSIFDAAEEKLGLLLDLERALVDGELFVVYQPKYSLSANQVLSAEALVRWNHPEKGFVRPDQFIPVLENEGRIDEMTLYVMRRVIDDIERWNATGQFLNIAINVSAILLSDAVFVHNALALITASKANSSQITLEVTESAALASPDAAIATLKKFKALGARISIDDYGTGQSTLSYLKQFPADEIKIDQEFVRAMEHVDADRIMVGSTIELAHALGFKVVAEGVEDGPCLDLLRNFGCDVVQGWHIGKPIPAAEFEVAWLNIGSIDSSVIRVQTH